MIDIVIPTMMRCSLDPMRYSIAQAVHSKYVNRIVIIDNSGESRFTKELDFDTNKIVVRTMEDNIYVNPAWNIGVSLCQSDDVLIMNDDIFCHADVYDQVSKVMKQFNVGICSVDTKTCKSTLDYLKYIDDFDNPIKTNEKFGNVQNNKSGWFFCVKKREWKELPQDMKLWYGDDLIYNRIRHSGYLTKNITSVKIGHMVSASLPTLGSDFRKIIDNDKIIYERVRSDYIR